MLDKTWTRFTLNIWARQNPPSPNERLSKGYRIGVIKALAHASHKTHGVVRQSLTRIKVPRSHKPMKRRFGTTP